MTGVVQDKGHNSESYMSRVMTLLTKYIKMAPDRRASVTHVVLLFIISHSPHYHVELFKKEKRKTISQH